MIDFQEIKKQFKGEVETDEASLVKNSRDASIFEVRPACIVHPKDSADLQSLVKWVVGQKQNHPELSITARSAGTDMSGGDLNESIIADFTKYFTRIIRIESGSVPIHRRSRTPIIGHATQGDGFAVVEPGVYYRDFEKATLEKKLILPCYTASKSLNTVGGMAANNSAGEKSLSYGQTKDYVEELNMVLSDGNEYVFGELNEQQLEQKLKLSGFEGEIYRKVFHLLKDNYQAIQKAKPTTSKNSAGYLLWEVWDKAASRFNLAKIFVGSQGTLGFVTKIKFKLVKPKEKSELLVIFLKDLTNLGDVVSTVVDFKPESFESFDDHTFKLAMRFLPDMIKRMKGNLITLGLQFLPEVWMTLTGGIPKLILIAEFTGDTEEEVREKMLEAQKTVIEKFKLKTHITKNPAEAEKYWTVRRESFSLLRQHSHGLATAPFIDDIAVHPAQLPHFLPELNALLAKYPSLIYTIAGHAGDANFHIIPLMDLTKPDQREIIPELADKVYNLVIKYQGTITAEHNDGLIRSPYLGKMYGMEITGLFAQVKQIFDPHNIFNPGKKVGSSLKYALEHIKRTL
jgi:FAD/FMN-containing dehydrogenase